MAPHKTVTINGRRYDAVTGLPIEEVQVTAPDKTPIKAPKPAVAAKKTPPTSRGTTSSAVAHSASVQRSQTLARRSAKKPAAPQKPIIKRTAPGRHMDIARSTSVTKFAAHPSTKPATDSVTKAVTAPIPTRAPKQVPTPAVKADKPARIHPLAARALARHDTKKNASTTSKPTTAKQVKDAEIAKALAAPKTAAPKRHKKDRKKLRRALIIAGTVLLLIVAVVAAWRLIPNLSVSVAAAQAGIEATYPEYTPDGYSLSQPVTFGDGEVSLKFVSHSNENYYTINQTRSSWDSSAVLDNVVTPAAGADYTTTKERGLTIYTYGSSAAWVNGGILYQIDSKAPLSGDQIRKIATSL
jgi:hypothetical protein